MEKNNKSYTNFSFEDFLQDEYFISSVKKPTPESAAYWECFCGGNQNIKNFEEAKSFIKSINQYHQTLSLDEINNIKQRIYKKKGRSRRLFYLSVAAAAVIALLVYLRFHGADYLTEKQDITVFADINRPDTKTGEIRLVLSDDQTVLIDRKETVISYDTAGIVADKEIIAQNETAGFNQLIVPYGKRSILTLADGTKVWVNSDSRLIYPASFDKKREIFVDGEIYIEVAEETNRPFVVRTKDIDVQVLGTRFNVTAYDADSERKIVLVSGSVQITSKKDNEVVRLLPEQMYLSENGQSQVVNVDIQRYISWIEGIYYCENENLGGILQRLSRYYGVEIACDPTIAEVVFSGKLDLKDNLSDICEGISFTLPVSYTQQDGKYIISKIKKSEH